MVSVAALAGMSAETLRKIESGRVPTPAFFTVAALAAVLGLSLDDLATACADPAAPLPTNGHLAASRGDRAPIPA